MDSGSSVLLKTAHLVSLSGRTLAPHPPLLFSSLPHPLHLLVMARAEVPPPIAPRSSLRKIRSTSQRTRPTSRSASRTSRPPRCSPRTRRKRGSRPRDDAPAHPLLRGGAHPRDVEVTKRQSEVQLLLELTTPRPSLLLPC